MSFDQSQDLNISTAVPTRMDIPAIGGGIPLSIIVPAHCPKRELAFRLERQRYTSTNYEHSNRVATGENREHKLWRPVLP